MPAADAAAAVVIVLVVVVTAAANLAKVFCVLSNTHAVTAASQYTDRRSIGNQFFISQADM